MDGVRETDRQTDRQTDRDTERHRETQRQTDRQTDRDTERVGHFDSLFITALDRVHDNGVKWYLERESSTRIVYDDELMLNVLRCHETY